MSPSVDGSAAPPAILAVEHSEGLTAAAALIHFWFGPDAGPDRWFRSDAVFNASLAERFGALVRRAAQGELDHWTASPLGSLGLLLLWDQLPRNLHRGTAAAFAQDSRALALADALIERGEDRLLEPIQRLFVALPLEHAEDPGRQEQAVAYLAALERQVAPGDRASFARFTDYARRHRAVIARFGRFPGRNAALGRRDSEREQQAVAAGEATF